MSSSPKYSDVQFVGDAGRTLAQAIASTTQSAMEAWEAARRRRETLRLERAQAEVRETAQSLSAIARQLRAQARAESIPLSLDDLERRLEQCASSNSTDLAGTRSLLSTLAAIERELTRSRRQFEAAKLGHALDGLAGQLASIRGEVVRADRRDSDQFDAGSLAHIEQAIRDVEKELAAKQIDRAGRGMAQIRQRLDEHHERVRMGREKYERERSEADAAIAAITDRCNAFDTTPSLSRYLKNDLARLQTDLEALRRLYRDDQFANVHQQARRLGDRLDELVIAAQKRIAQAEKQKALTERLVATVLAARGVLLAGYPQHAEGKPSVLRFRVAGRGVLHVEIGPEGPVTVRAEGFKLDQHLGPNGKMERTCDDFVEWFEQIRNAARTQGLEIGQLRWEGEPTPERARARRKTHSSAHNTVRVNGRVK